jgi:hypothetical protein
MAMESSASSPVKVKRRFVGTYSLRLHGQRISQTRIMPTSFFTLFSLLGLFFDLVFATCFMLVSRLAYYSMLKMEATYFSEMSVGFQ